MTDLQQKLQWALEVLNPDNLTATPPDKVKAWLYLKEYLSFLLNE